MVDNTKMIPDSCLPNIVYISQRGNLNITTATLGGTLYLNKKPYPIEAHQQIFPHQKIEEKVFLKDETKKFYHYQWIAQSEITAKVTYKEFPTEQIKNWPQVPSETYSIVQQKPGDKEEIKHLVCLDGSSGDEVSISNGRVFLIECAARKDGKTIENIVKDADGKLYIIKYRNLAQEEAEEKRQQKKEKLKKAKEENADIVGLSGLITPSLEEMAYVASEMQRDDYFLSRNIPLLVGGATTSRVHTAVKIAPHYEGPVIYVPDASRSVGVATNLMSDQVDTYLGEVKEEYELVRKRHANRKETPLVSLDEARAGRPVIDWTNYTPPRPKFIGRRAFKNYDLAEIVKYLDWTPFFQTWSLFGQYPAILQDKVVGEAAQKVFAEGQAMLKKVIDGRWLTANGVVAFYPANTVNDDDIEVYRDESRSEVLFTWRNVRQQTVKREGVDNKCLADYIAPKSTGITDYIGFFAVTGGLGIEKYDEKFLADNDDYSSIMLKSIADRLAEGFAECLHARVRQDLWGYVPNEALDNEAMIAEKYQGIRPAPGYPACPEHVVKKEMFQYLECDDIDMQLTDSYAMFPASSVSGFYLSHPQSQYFNVGSIGDDQVKDYVQRSGRSEEDVRRTLASCLR